MAGSSHAAASSHAVVNLGAVRPVAPPVAGAANALGKGTSRESSHKPTIV